MKSNQIKTAFKVTVIESEKGWGRGINDYMICLSKNDAKEFIKQFNAKNILTTTPDWYLQADIEIRQISLSLNQHDFLLGQPKGRCWLKQLNNIHNPQTTMNKTKTTSASVKVMQSYNYNHFEVILGISDDEGLTMQEINEKRKDAQRLTDEAVRQYKKSKDMAANRERGGIQKDRFLEEIRCIEKKPLGERTVDELAKLKQYEDEQWEKQFEYEYDYEDGFVPPF